MRTTPIETLAWQELMLRAELSRATAEIRRGKDLRSLSESDIPEEHRESYRNWQQHCAMLKTMGWKWASEQNNEEEN